MANLNFASQVSDWVKQTQGAVAAVFHEASQRVVEEMTTPRGSGGNMPVDTGFLRASLLASTSAMPQIRKNAKPTAGTTYAYSAGPVNLIISTATLGQTVYVGFGASYSAHVNFGANGHPGALFVDLAAQKWPTIVAQVEAELGQRLGRV